LAAGKAELGQIKPGAFADLLVVDGNPLEGTSACSRTRAPILSVIMKGGHFHKNRLAPVMAARLQRRLGRWTLRAAAVLCFAVMLLPIVFVCWISFFSNAILSFPPEGYTLKWFQPALACSRNSPTAS